MSVPANIREEVSSRLWGIADGVGWLNLSANSKSRYYDNWTKDPQIGGRLARFLDPGQVRLYIKDAIMKRHARERRARTGPILSALGLSPSLEATREYIKPHGCLLTDGSVICWGRANNWKLVLMAVHERAFVSPRGVAFGAVLSQSAGHFGDERPRAVVADAAYKLGIQKLVWLLD